MANQDFQAWCKAATKLIRYAPDREAVRAELQAHLEDHYDALIARGTDPETAAEQTLASMGSAMEIAPELGKIHRPWLGYLYNGTLALAVMLWLGMLLVGTNLLPYYNLAEVLNLGMSQSEMTVDTQSVAYVRQQDAAVFADGYHVQVVETIRVPEEGYLFIEIKVAKTDRFGLVALDHLWAVDDLGNTYASSYTYQWESKKIHFQEEISSGNLRYLQLVVTDVDPQAQWLELRYDRDGRDIVLRLELTGGVIYESP